MLCWGGYSLPFQHPLLVCPSIGSGVHTAYGVDDSRILIANQESGKQVQKFKSICFDFLNMWIFISFALWILIHQCIDQELEETK